MILSKSNSDLGFLGPPPWVFVATVTRACFLCFATTFKFRCSVVSASWNSNNGVYTFCCWNSYWTRYSCPFVFESLNTERTAWRDGVQGCTKWIPNTDMMLPTVVFVDLWYDIPGRVRDSIGWWPLPTLENLTDIVMLFSRFASASFLHPCRSLSCLMFW